jgi:hypothetical protein
MSQIQPFRDAKNCRWRCKESKRAPLEGFTKQQYLATGPYIIVEPLRLLFPKTLDFPWFLNLAIIGFGFDFPATGAESLFTRAIQIGGNSFCRTGLTRCKISK